MTNLSRGVSRQFANAWGRLRPFIHWPEAMASSMVTATASICLLVTSHRFATTCGEGERARARVVKRGQEWSIRRHSKTT